MTVLLDTNVLSEAGKPSPNRNVRAFLLETANLWVSAISLHEIEYGINLLPSGQRRFALERDMGAVIAAFGQKLLAVGEAEARRAAQYRAQARRRGRVLHMPDALIAATAKEHGLTLATRNVRDFADLDLHIVNPWTA